MAILAALYGLVVYLLVLATFVYAIGFVGNLPLLPRRPSTVVPQLHSSRR